MDSQYPHPDRGRVQPAVLSVARFNATKAVRIARDLNADAIRYPTASYYAYFPTRSGYPVHPELKDDPLRETAELCRKAGLKLVAYLPLNHPFMEVTSKDRRFAGWSKRFADGKPMTTEHYGFTRYYEGCLNSPVRDVIKAMVREVLVGAASAAGRRPESW